ncbi:MAG: hypothetical protein GY858_09015 [Candidatus Omnitrophica bacterium]|nr:hypothetical protein [Candidatus Omnitrophota bacterium]
MTKKAKEHLTAFSKTNPRFIYLIVIISLLLMHFSVYKIKQQEIGFLNQQIQDKSEHDSTLIEELRNEKELLHKENAQLKNKLSKMIKVMGIK